MRVSEIHFTLPLYFAISVRKRSQKRSISLTRENRNIRMIKDISWLRGAWIAGLCSRRAQAFSIMQEGAKMSYSSWLCGNKCHMAGMRAPLYLCHAILIRVSHRKLLCREAVRLMRSLSTKEYFCFMAHAIRGRKSSCM